MTTARDTIVDALDIESFGLCAGGPKAPNMTAQGNALGINTQTISSPERASQNSRGRFFSPLQGASFCGLVSRGVAPVCPVIALSARDKTATEKFWARLANTNPLGIQSGIFDANGIQQTA